MEKKRPLGKIYLAIVMIILYAPIFFLIFFIPLMQGGYE